MSSSSAERRSIEISARTLLVAAACIGGVWLLVRLWPVLLVVAASLILVGTLNPIVGALQERGLRRGAAVAVTLLTLLGAFAGLALVTAPALWAELGRFVHELPRLQVRVAAWLERSAFTMPLADSIREADPGKFFVGSGREAFELSSRFGARVGYAATTVALAVYMLLDPERSQGALYAIVPRQFHVRLARVLLGLETIVGGYVRGQLLTSAAIGAYVFGLLTIFGMPSALPLAVFAALADVLPLVGGALTLVPIALVALPHGMPMTVTLVALVITYQELENRIIVPRVYPEDRVLRLDAVAVTLALLVGAQLGGVLGAATGAAHRLEACACSSKSCASSCRDSPARPPPTRARARSSAPRRPTPR